jgi:predicted dehydrogenase
MQSDSKVKLAVIATGARSWTVVADLQRAGDQTEIVAVFDPDRERVAKRLKSWKSPDAQVCDTYQEAIQREDVDWVMVFSPNAYHREHIICALEAGKHVFTEKPLATSIDDCQAIYEAHQKTDRLFATGFVLRYAPLYRKTKELLDQGFIGRILSIDANENIAPDHGAYIMKNWRRLKSLSGPHILEKCCHDLDLLNWFCESLPSKVASFGGRDFFVPENAHMHEKFTNKEGKSLFTGWTDPHAEPCAFKAEKDMMDNQVAIMEYRNNIRVMFQATMSNAIPERRMYFSGTEGTLIVELYTGLIRAKRLDEEETRIFDFSQGGGHAGGDTIIMRELYDTMLNGTPPKCSGEEGLTSAVVALAIEEAKDRGAVFDLEPVWERLGR